METHLDDKINGKEERDWLEDQQGSDLIGLYFKEMGKKPMLTPKQEIELAKEIEDRHRELIYVLCQYDGGDSETNGLALLERGLEEFLGKKSAYYNDFLKLKNSISRSSKAETLTERYEQVFELLYHSKKINGSCDKDCESKSKKVTGQFICDVARESAATMPQKYQTIVANYLSSIEQTKKRFVEANLRLVIKIAKDYRGGGLPFLDLIQEGNIGLMKAVGRFDHRKGFRFATYAAWWIRQGIQKSIYDKGKTVRLTVSANRLLEKCKKTANELSQQLEREPSNEEVAERMGVPIEEVNYVFNVGGTVSLNRSISDDDKKTFFEFVKGEENNFPEYIWIKDGKELLSVLKPREAKMMIKRFGLDGEGERTLTEIGKQHGVSRERVRQLQEKSLEEIREKFGIEVNSKKNKIETLFANLMPLSSK